MYKRLKAYSIKLGITNFRYWNFGIKAGVFLLFLWIFYGQVLAKDNLYILWSDLINHLEGSKTILLLIVIFLMPVNWILETLKWRHLLSEKVKLSFIPALKAVMSGITLSLLTPNRVGEYGGRILFVRPGDNWHAVSTTLVGSFSQNLVNIVMGLIGALFVLKAQAESFGSFWFGLGITLTILIGMLFYIYFNISAFYSLFGQIKKPRILQKLIARLHLVKKITQQRLTIALLLSFLRYIIFSMQFILLLIFFGVDVPILELICGVCAIFLFHTTIPLPPFIDILARGEIGIILWSANELSILSASFFIWIINLLIPALIGLMLIGSVNVLKSLGYDKSRA